MQFLGWELSTGEIVNGYWTDSEGKHSLSKPNGEAEFTRVPQHLAGDLRNAIGYKKRLKPRYQL